MPTNNEYMAHDLRILNAIRRIVRAADIDSRHLAAEHGITAPQLMSLLAIVEKGTITAIEIAQRIHVGASTIVGILDRLEEKGLIRRTRSTEDRRLVLIEATDGGRALAAATPFPLQYSLDRVFRQLSEEEREGMTACFERLAALIGADDIEPSPMLEINALALKQD